MTLAELLKFIDNEIEDFVAIQPRDLYTQGRMIALYRLRKVLKDCAPDTPLHEVVSGALVEHYVLPKEVKTGINHELIVIACLCSSVRASG